MELHMLGYDFMVLNSVWLMHMYHGTPTWKGTRDEVSLETFSVLKFVTHDKMTIWKNWYDFVAQRHARYKTFLYRRYQIIGEVPQFPFALQVC